MPFDALKGLKEALKAKEEKLTRVAKRELSEEQQENLSEVITQLEKGMLVKATFYYKGTWILSQRQKPFPSEPRNIKKEPGVN